MTADCGIGWHRHPGGWWVWGVATGDGCALCEDAETWRVEQARAAPVEATRIENASKPSTFAATMAARRKRKAGEQSGLF